MREPTKSELVKIARKVRKECEKKQKEDSYFPQDLTGMCAIAAAKVHEECKKEGYQPFIAVTHNNLYTHCYVHCGGFLIDVTATQFSNTKTKKIVVIPIEQAQEECWKKPKKFKTSRSLKILQRREGWPEQQTI